jgi:hypothetical protein
LTTGRVLHADDPPPAGDTKVVPIKSFGNIKVQEANPYKNLHVPPPAPAEKYDPRNYSMNQTSSLANKQFSADSIAISKKGPLDGQANFATKSYGTLNSEAQAYNGKYATSNATEVDHGDAQFNRNYATSSSKMSQSQATSFASTSNDQNRTSDLGDKKSKVFDAGLAKQYVGPGAQHVPDGSVKENVVLASVKDLPNRPLTIDEVRGLINHGFKPDLNDQPTDPSKAMNDPDYKPEASPEPIETIKVPVTEDDKNDPLPSPGTMSQPPPENSVPLPQH